MAKERIQMESNQKYGTVKVWNFERGFGYIRASNGKDYFMHISNWMSDGNEPPTAGQQVVFELGLGITKTKPPQATNVRLQTEIETGANALAGGAL
jgi:CspA family cold shock protein